MPQIITKERTAYLASYTNFYKRCWSIKTHHFHSSSNLQESRFNRTIITSYFRPVNIAKFLRIVFFIEHLQKQSLADVLQNSFAK